VTASSLAVALFIPASVLAQGAAADWFPTHVGEKWTYEHETRDDNGGGRDHLEVKRWTSEETITSARTIPEGTLLQVSVAPATRAERNAYLVRGDCVYALHADWGETAGEGISSAFRAGLSAGRIAPDFCFPLRERKTWGAQHWGDRRASEAKDWQVKGGPAGQNTFHIVSISSYPGSGMTVDLWFQKGVGVIREESIHHGTIGEERVRLVRFDPAH
jgi:hypothetical protein